MINKYFFGYLTFVPRCIKNPLKRGDKGEFISPKRNKLSGDFDMRWLCECEESIVLRPRSWKFGISRSIPIHKKLFQYVFVLYSFLCSSTTTTQKSYLQIPRNPAQNFHIKFRQETFCSRLQQPLAFFSRGVILRREYFRVH